MAIYSCFFTYLLIKILSKPNKVKNFFALYWSGDDLSTYIANYFTIGNAFAYGNGIICFSLKTIHCVILFMHPDLNTYIMFNPREIPRFTKMLPDFVRDSSWIKTHGQ